MIEKTNENMNQSEFVAWAQRQHQFEDETFENAHYPLPKGEGDETIKLHPLDHAIQGVFQSEEVGRRCFFTPDTKAALNASGYFPPGWFEAWDLFEKWQGKTSCCDAPYEQQQEWRSNAGKVQGRRNVENGHLRRIGFKGGNVQGRKAHLSGQLAEARAIAHEKRKIRLRITSFETGQAFEFSSIKETSEKMSISTGRLRRALSSETGIIHMKWFENYPEFRVEKI